MLLKTCLLGFDQIGESNGPTPHSQPLATWLGFAINFARILPANSADLAVFAGYAGS